MNEPSIYDRVRALEAIRHIAKEDKMGSGKIFTMTQFGDDARSYRFMIDDEDMPAVAEALAHALEQGLVKTRIFTESHLRSIDTALAGSQSVQTSDT